VSGNRARGSQRGGHQLQLVCWTDRYWGDAICDAGDHVWSRIYRRLEGQLCVFSNADNEPNFSSRERDCTCHGADCWMIWA